MTDSPALGDVGGEKVIEGAIFADQHDDVLDGRAGVRFFLLMGLQRGCERAPQAELEHGHGDESNAKTMQSFCCCVLQCHAFSSRIVGVKAETGDARVHGRSYMEIARR